MMVSTAYSPDDIIPIIIGSHGCLGYVLVDGDIEVGDWLCYSRDLFPFKVYKKCCGNM